MREWSLRNLYLEVIPSFPTSRTRQNFLLMLLERQSRPVGSPPQSLDLLQMVSGLERYGCGGEGTLKWLKDHQQDFMQFYEHVEHFRWFWRSRLILSAFV